MRGKYQRNIEVEIKLRCSAYIVSSYAKYNRINRFELPAVICIISEALFFTSENTESKF